MTVRTMSGRSTVADGEMGETTIGRGTAYTTEIIMTGRRKHIQLRLSTTGIGTTFYGFYQIIIHTYGYRVGIRIVIAEERCVVADVLTHLFPILPIGSAGIQHLFHRVALVLEDMFLQSCETVGNRTQTRALDVRCVVTRTTAIVVLTLFYTVVYIQTEEGGRCIE